MRLPVLGNNLIHETQCLLFCKGKTGIQNVCESTNGMDQQYDPHLKRHILANTCLSNIPQHETDKKMPRQTLNSHQISKMFFKIIWTLLLLLLTIITRYYIQ